MSDSAYSEVVETARQYYNSEDADNFYYHVWGGQDIHIGMYSDMDEPIADASRRTVEHMAGILEGVDSSSRIIDFGSGYGGSARYLAERFGCHVTALNLSETENERNRNFNQQQGLSSQVDVIDGSFEQAPVADESYDVVWSQDAILHSGHRDRVMAEAARVLKKGGQFIFTDPMQADDCPEGVLQPVLDRIHLDTLGSFDYYTRTAVLAGFEVKSVEDHTSQLVNHYTRVREVLERDEESLHGTVSDEYIERMIQGLGHWVTAGEKGYLAWGVIHLVKA